MSLKEDIKWLQSEISKVKDPDFIAAFKSLLKYHKKQENKAELSSQSKSPTK
jgi:hypothetical protein